KAQSPGPQAPALAKAPAQNPRTPAPSTSAQASAAQRPAPYKLPSQSAFEAVTTSLFDNTCSECHNKYEYSGKLDIDTYRGVETLTTDRARWELILGKLKGHEMPPPDHDRPDKEIDALTAFLEKEFDKADASMTPDPGRVTARRLNRAEYTNTIR